MQKDPYKYEPHGPWIPVKGVGKQKCVKCGLVALNNKFTEWAISKGCNHEDHPDHDRKRKLTNPFKGEKK